MTTEETAEAPIINEPRLWSQKGWTARVIKNGDDDGWAVEMIKDGEGEPALVGPWTMGRDKKNPKPLDHNAFNTLVKTVTEFVRRSEQQRHALYHQQVTVNTDAGPIRVMLDIVPDEYDPYGILSAQDALGESLAEVRVNPGFKLSNASANAWIDNDYLKPGGRG